MVTFHGDYLNEEWGYVSFSELKAIKVDFLKLDCETEDAWWVRPAREVEAIV